MARKTATVQYSTLASDGALRAAGNSAVFDGSCVSKDSESTGTATHSGLNLPGVFSKHSLLKVARVDVSFRRAGSVLIIRVLVNSGDRLDGQGEVAMLAAKETENKLLATLIGIF